MDLKIKTFHIHSAEDERALNEFLAGKFIRHWATSFTPSGTGAITHAISGSGPSNGNSGVWNVLVAYEERQNNEPRLNRNDRNEPAHPFAPRKLPERYNKRDAQAQAPKPKEKPVHEDYKPNIAESDVPLFEALRKWRNERAREERVKPFTLFNNRQLEEIVTKKPSTPDALHAIASDMDPVLREKYQNELLGFIEAANSAGGNAAATVAAQETAEAAV